MIHLAAPQRVFRFGHPSRESVLLTASRDAGHSASRGRGPNLDQKAEF